jgi:pyridoxal phosphate enzyme (YggS family)
LCLGQILAITVRVGIFALNLFNMPINRDAYREIVSELQGQSIALVAVSKTKTVEDILALYAEGQRDFGENYVQELLDKHLGLPADIRWHFIGHLQTNKVKQLISFVYLIHGVDSLRLLKEIDRQAAKVGRVVDVLLQVHIAREETKFGLDTTELEEVMGAKEALKHVRVRGLMGMAANTEDVVAVRSEFRGLKTLFDGWFSDGGILSAGMSGDYRIAIEEGSNMVRIGSLLFGPRGENL